MALQKTLEDIDSMRRGGKILSVALAAAVAEAKQGVALRDLDHVAETSMRAAGAVPSFLGYQGSPKDLPFPSTMCISVNEEVVHGLGSRTRKLKDGDVVGFDIGCWYEGLCTDMAVTIPIGDVGAEKLELIAVTREATLAAASKIRIGGTVADVGRIVEHIVNPHGYGILRTFVGHGVGHAVHEEPRVPNFYDPRDEKKPLLERMCLAIEPMLTLGDYNVKTKKDGWAVVTVDGSVGAHFEVTVVLLANGPEILTPLPV